MKLRNPSNSFRYSKLANKSLEPGKFTRDLPTVKDFVNKFFESCKGFQYILSESDLSEISRLLDNACSEEDFAFSALSTSDPTGMDRVVSALKEKREKKQLDQREAMKFLREKEARIQAESNMIDEDGNPINDKLLSQAAIKDIEPELHPEMGSDIDKIMANNMAVMNNKEPPKPKIPDTISLGVEDFAKKNPNAIIAKGGTNPIPHDPKFYQNQNKTVPPGVPDVPGAAEQYKDASTWKPAPGMPVT